MKDFLGGTFTIFVLVIMLSFLVSSARNTERSLQADHATTTPSEGTTSPREAGGIGMTFGGKMGFDLGSGIILPFDGSGIGIGFGF